jgi:long-chain acyl-CoA synthetase
MKVKLIDALLNQPPNKTFLIIDDKTISYGDFLKLVSKTISFLKKSSKKYVFINSEKNEFTLAAYFASSKLGKISAFIDPLSKYPELFTGLSNDDGIYFSNEDYKEVTKSEFKPIINSEQVTHNDISEIIFTTGTTGSPKGVLISHETTLNTAININKFTGLKNADVEMHMMPISHSFGLARVRCCVLKGCTIIFQNGFSNLASFFIALEQYKGTVISTVPAGIQFLIKLTKDKISNYQSQIRMIELGSSPMTSESKIELTQLLPNTDICMHYGLTEASRSTFLDFKKDYKFISSVGKANKGTKILIIDKNDNKCSNNDNGEVCIAGTNLFSGYAFTKIKPQYHKEYFKTGDYGYLDDNGYLFFQGRKDDMMNISGKKVSPIEIEKYINQVSFIRDVACIEAENKRTGLVEIKAFVVLDDKKIVDNWSSEIKKYLKNKIEYYKIPARIVNIDSIPKSHNGKILRIKLKEDNEC